VADFTIETVAGGTTKIGTSGNKLAINSGGGNVGIGETSPQTIVHATSTNSTAPTSGTTPVGYGFSFGAGNGNNAGIWFSAGLGGDQGICGIAGSRVSNYETDLRFYTNNTNSARAFSERMRITRGGAIEATGSIKTGAPSGGTAKPWKFGARVADTNLYLDSSQYIELDVDGTLYKLATIVKL